MAPRPGGPRAQANRRAAWRVLVKTSFWRACTVENVQPQDPIMLAAWRAYLGTVAEYAHGLRTEYARAYSRRGPAWALATVRALLRNYALQTVRDIAATVAACN